MDEIAQGSYKGEKNGKLQLCAVGCALHSLNVIRGKSLECGSHQSFETELGIPRIIARLEDGIFEGLKFDEAKTFPYEFIEAVPVGVDLSLVWLKFLHWLLVDEEHGVIKFIKNEDWKKAVLEVATLYQRKINGEDVKPNEWLEARENAWKVRRAADAAYAAADAAARQKARSIQKEKLLQLIRESK